MFNIRLREKVEGLEEAVAYYRSDQIYDQARLTEHVVSHHPTMADIRNLDIHLQALMKHLGLAWERTEPAPGGIRVVKAKR